mgnify:FL=1
MVKQIEKLGEAGGSVTVVPHESEAQRGSVDSLSLPDKIKSIAAPFLRSLGLELFVVQISGHQLRVFIDKEAGVTIEDCGKLSRLLNPALDVADDLPYSYSLEVSSPGLNRPLRHEEDYVRFIGKKVKIKTCVKIMEQKVFIGHLDAFESGTVRMTTDGGDKCEIPFEQISKGCLEVDFPTEKTREVKKR